MGEGILSTYMSAENEPLRYQLTYSFISSTCVLLVYFFAANHEIYSYVAAGVVSVLIVLRVIQYTMLNLQYFLIDFCYPTNILMIYNVLNPTSSFLLFFGACASFNTLTSVHMYRNALRFNNLNDSTSFAIHFILSTVYFPKMFAGEIDYLSLDPVSFVVKSCSIVLAYFAFYHIFIFYITASHWRSKNILTLYTHLKKTFGLEPFSLRVGERMTEITFTAVGVFLSSYSFFIGFYIFQMKTVLYGFQLVTFLRAVWYGGKFKTSRTKSS